MKLKISLLVFFTLIFFSQGFAQKIVTGKKLRKISITPQIGLAVFPAGMNYNDLGMPKNIFGGYAPGLMIGAGLWYKSTPRIFFGLNGGFLITQRESNSLNLIKMGLLAKFNFLDPYKYILSPYIIGGINVSFLNIFQSRQVKEFYPQDTSLFGDGVKTVKVERNYNQLEMYMSPIVGPVFGGGFETKISNKISLFFQATIETSFGTNSQFRDKYPDNQSLLSYTSFQAGTTIRLFKKIKVEIDTVPIFVPDHIAELSPSNEIENIEKLSREVSFQVKLKEGVKHVIDLENSSSEINLQLEEYDSPCKKRAMLYDELGNKVREKIVRHHEVVSFKDLKPGKYKVIIEVDPPCPHTSFSYKINSDGNKITHVENEEMLANVASLIDSTNKFVGFKLESLDKIKMYTMYSVDGHESILAGYGYQVGAFVNLNNAIHLMEKLKKEGFEMYGQAVMSNDINQRFKTTNNYKLMRVIVFAGPNELRANEIKQLLSEGGYQIIVKEHFRPESKANYSHLNYIKAK